jgi:hypothetical protein
VDRSPFINLFPTTPLALDELNGFMGLPSMMAQITTFQCGGTAVAVKMSHPLADARALMSFMDDWAAVNRSLVQGVSLPVPTPIFDPSLSDKQAAGDVNPKEPDQETLEVAQSLPLNRHDY